MILLGLFFSFLLFFMSWMLTKKIRVLALKKQILDIPNQRSLHVVPTPRGGGLAFVVVFYSGLMTLFFHYPYSKPLFCALLGGIPVAVIGYLDDLYSIRSSVRALVHFSAAIWGVCFLLPLFSFWSFFIEVFFVVWFINLYNFMDGVDGLAGMEAVFVALSASVLLLLRGDSFTSAICFILAISVFGFLVLNWAPAKIFMGDVGSGFLGYIFAILMWSTHITASLPLLVWWILLGIFIGDATYTLFHRVLQKKKWYLAHREHVYQRIVQSGVSHAKITGSVLLLNGSLCLPLAYYCLNHLSLVNYFFLALVLFSWLCWLFLVKRYPLCKL